MSKFMADAFCSRRGALYSWLSSPVPAGPGEFNRTLRHEHAADTIK